MINRLDFFRFLLVLLFSIATLVSSAKLLNLESALTTFLETFAFITALTYLSDIASVLLISIHSILVVANFVSVDLMQTHVNGELLLNVISALSTGANTKSSADPTMILYYAFPTLASEVLFYKLYKHISKDTTTSTFLKTSFILYLVAFTAFSGYSPIKNIVLSVFEMAAFQNIAFSSSTQSTQETSNSTTNVVIILNESMGNKFFQSETGVNASSFYHSNTNSDFYKFTNARAGSGNTVTGTPASLWGYLITADPKSDEARDYYTAPSLIQLAKSRNYSTALYCAYDTHFPAGGWDNLNYLFDLFDHVVSKSTLGRPENQEVNALGMDDRKITERVLIRLNRSYFS
jgi:hypothetical protein